MTVKLSDVIPKGDFVKIGILIIISVICWVWVWREYQKPIIPPEWEQQLKAENV
jgi:hypothetical protein